MGDEIANVQFNKRDFEQYKYHLIRETALLRAWIEQHRICDKRFIAGLELEAWIVDQSMMPAPRNTQCMARIASDEVVPELAKFNLELNVTPQALDSQGLHKLQQELASRWTHCQQVLAPMQLSLLMIGILPTVRHSDLNIANMSEMNRYKALNEQVLASRQGRPLVLDIVGEEHIRLQHQDVMLESAATSFQLHLQVPVDKASRYYNTAIMVSAPLVALSANSPYLFGKDIWEETRIPLFEQSVDVGGYDGAARGPVKRVTFGSGYVRQSIVECFEENLSHYPILLPMVQQRPEDQLPHLRLHNGTIWRWNRPLIGFDQDGRPHVRIEHRVMPAGPTVVDMIANAAFYYGLIEYLANQPGLSPALALPFTTARGNFYAAARFGLQAVVTWFDGKKGNIRDLILRQLLPFARQGLEHQQVSKPEQDYYLSIIERRVESGQNGAAWQRRFVVKHGRDMQAMTMAYQQNQQSQRPVSEWSAA